MSYDPSLNLDLMAKQGRTFAASTDGVALTAAGRARAALVNPAGSGRVVHLIGIVVNNASAAPGTIRQWHNPTAGVPTAVAPIPAKNCSLLASPDPGQAPKAAFYSDWLQGSLAPMAGGSPLPTLACPAQSRQVYAPSPLLLAPGVTLGLDATFGAVAIVGNSIISIYWYEDSA